MSAHSSRRCTDLRRRQCTVDKKMVASFSQLTERGGEGLWVVCTSFGDVSILGSPCFMHSFGTFQLQTFRAGWLRRLDATLRVMLLQPRITTLKLGDHTSAQQSSLLPRLPVSPRVFGFHGRCAPRAARCCTSLALSGKSVEPTRLSHRAAEFRLMDGAGGSLLEKLLKQDWPWVYEHDATPARVIATLKTLEILVAIKVLMLLTELGTRKQLRVAPSVTDSGGNGPPNKILTSRFPLSAIFMNLNEVRRTTIRSQVEWKLSKAPATNILHSRTSSTFPAAILIFTSRASSNILA